MRVLSIDDFSLPHMMAAADSRAQFDAALLFSTKYEPPKRLFADWPAWERTKARFFGYHRDLPPEVAAHMLGGVIVFEQHLGGQWVAVVDLQKAEEVKGFSVLSSQRPVLCRQHHESRRGKFISRGGSPDVSAAFLAASTRRSSHCPRSDMLVERLL
jgi:hypothetical protein